MIFTTLALTFAGFALAYATFWLGAFDPYRFILAAAVIALASLLAFFSTKPQDRSRPIPLWAAIPLALIPLYLAYQLIPLPLGVLTHL